MAVLASLATVMVVPSQPFRTSALGILLAVGFVLAASLTLLPALLARLGPRIDRFTMPWAGAVQHRSEAFARWGRVIWRRPVLTGGLALLALVALALPALGLRTAMPSTGVLPADASARVGYERLQDAFGHGAANELHVVAPASESGRVLGALEQIPDVAVATPQERHGRFVLTRVSPTTRTGQSELVDRLRSRLPDGAIVGGAAAEAHDLEHALAVKLPLVYGLVVAVGFVLLVLVVRAPLAAGAAVLMNLLATAAAFGVAKLIFQDGRGEALFGFSSQGFVDAWAPIFFFALIFALAMDYSVFLLSSVRAEFERTGDPRAALVEGLASSGRVINAAGAVMVVVFFTFALSGPLAAEGDGRDPRRGGAARHAARAPAAATGTPAPVRPARMVDTPSVGPPPGRFATPPHLRVGYLRVARRGCGRLGSVDREPPERDSPGRGSGGCGARRSESVAGRRRAGRDREELAVPAGVRAGRRVHVVGTRGVESEAHLGYGGLFDVLSPLLDGRLDRLLRGPGRRVARRVADRGGAGRGSVRGRGRELGSAGDGGGGRAGAGRRR